MNQEFKRKRWNAFEGSLARWYPGRTEWTYNWGDEEFPSTQRKISAQRLALIHP